MSKPSESAERTLLVSEGNATEAGDSASRVATLRIDEELKNTSVDRHDEVYGALSDLAVVSDLPVPLFEISWAHIVDSRFGGLLQCVLFHERLAAQVERHDPDVIVCDASVGRGYSAVALDLGQTLDVRVETQVGSHLISRRVKRVVINSVLILPFLLDSMASLVIGRFLDNFADADTVFVPALLRLDSTLPVLEQASFDFDVVVASMASSWAWIIRKNDLDPFDPVPVSIFTDFRRIQRQIRLYWEVTKAVFLGDAFKDELRDALEAELDVQLDRTVEHALIESFRTRMFTSLFLYPLFEGAFRSGGTERVVIGSLSPAGRTIIAAALDNDVDVYHLPHSIATGYAPNPHPLVTQFASGSLEIEYYGGTKQVRHPWEMAVTGRPYLTELYRRVGSNARSKVGREGPLQVLVATQPLAQSRTFVSNVVTAVDAVEYDAKVVIKVHPSESHQDYAEFADSRRWVRTAESDLYGLIEESDVTVTINSNVGLESVIAGTPCVCVNHWSPLLLTPPYARACEGIPVLRNEEDVGRFFADLDRKWAEEMRVVQGEFVHQKYVLTEDAVQNILDHLEPTSTP